MKYLYVFGLLACLIIFGCVQQASPYSQTQNNNQQTQTTQNQPTCEKTTTQEPYQEQECNSVPYTSQECEQKALTSDYSKSGYAAYTYCSKYKDECQEYFLGLCSKSIKVCAAYSYKCPFVIRNLDVQGGTWKLELKVLDASKNIIPMSKLIYSTLDSNGNPITSSVITEIYRQWSVGDALVADIYIKPQSSFDSSNAEPMTFDASADLKLPGSYCYIGVVQEPTKQVCRDVIKYRQDCNYVTKYKTVEKEVCR